MISDEEKVRADLKLSPIDWRLADISAVERAIFTVGSFFLDDIFLIQDVVSDTGYNTSDGAMLAAYEENPTRITALGLHILVDRNFITEAQADDLAKRWQAAIKADEKIEKSVRPSEPIATSGLFTSIASAPTHIKMFVDSLKDSDGLHIILGAAESGKSRLLYELWEATKEHSSHHVYCEPDFRSLGDSQKMKADLKQYLSERSKAIKGDDDAVQRLLRFKETSDDTPSVINGDRDLVIIDSMKDLIYASGNLGRGGVSMSGLSTLSQISAAASNAASVVVSTINPLRDELLTELYDMIRGAVAGIWLITDDSILEGHYRRWNGSHYDRLSINIPISRSSDSNIRDRSGLKRDPLIDGSDKSSLEMKDPILPLSIINEFGDS